MSSITPLSSRSTPLAACESPSSPVLPIFTSFASGVSEKVQELFTGFLNAYYCIEESENLPAKKIQEMSGLLSKAFDEENDQEVQIVLLTLKKIDAFLNTEGKRVLLDTFPMNIQLQSELYFSKRNGDFVKLFSEKNLSTWQEIQRKKETLCNLIQTKCQALMWCRHSYNHSYHIMAESITTDIYNLKEEIRSLEEDLFRDVINASPEAAKEGLIKTRDLFGKNEDILSYLFYK